MVWVMGLSLKDPTVGADAGPAKVASALAGFLTGSYLRYQGYRGM